MHASEFAREAHLRSKERAAGTKGIYSSLLLAAVVLLMKAASCLRRVLVGGYDVVARPLEPESRFETSRRPCALQESPLRERLFDFFEMMDTDIYAKFISYYFRFILLKSALEIFCTNQVRNICQNVVPLRPAYLSWGVKQ